MTMTSRDVSWWSSPETTGLAREGARASFARESVSLNGTWLLQLVPHPSAPLTDEWTSASVPGVWTMSDAGDPPIYLNTRMPFASPPPHTTADNPTGVYRRTLTAPADWSGDRMLLRVDATAGAYQVEIDDILVGISKGSRLPAEFDITDMVHPGGSQLTITIPRWSDAAFLEDQDQWWHAGLAGSVSLVRVPRLHIADVTLEADFDPTTGTGAVSAEVIVRHGRENVPSGLHVTVALDDGPGSRAAVKAPDMMDAKLRATESTTQIPPGVDPFTLFYLANAGAELPAAVRPIVEEARRAMYPVPDGHARLQLEVLHAHPWSAETPHLYDAMVELTDQNGTVIDRAPLRFGFRRVRIEGSDLRVNGERIMVQGVNRHEFEPRTGRIRSRAQIAHELAVLKQHGVNAIRTSHYPACDDFYDLADEYGFYVVDEADLETHAHRTQLAADTRFLTATLDRVMRTVERNKNRTCVIAWSLGNESGTGPNLTAAAAWVRSRDQSRPLLYEGAIALDWHGGHAETDIVAPMYPPLEALAAYSGDPRTNRPLIMSEYQHAMGNSNGGFADYWRLIRSSPHLQGGFIWELWDHGLDPDGDDRYRYGGDFGEDDHDGSFCIDGLLFPDGTPHPSMAEVRHVFAALEFSASEPSDTGDSVLIRNRQSFAGTARFAVRACAVDHDGRPGEMIEIPLPAVAPGGQVAVQLPSALSESAGLGIRFELRTRFDEAWAAAGALLDVTQVTRSPLEARPPRTRPGSAADSAAEVRGITREPALTLWRALTDNDKSRFVQPRLESFAMRDAAAIDALGVRHERTLTRVDDRMLRIDDTVEIPPHVIEVPRVGFTLGVDAELSRVEWLGDGPHESYADRRDAAMPGRWHAELADMHTPYIRPQENGGRTGTVEIALTDAEGRGIRIRTDRPVQFSVTRFADATLERTAHDWELVPEPDVLVHVDIAHRGLGTASVGPDTDPAHRVGPGTYSLTWWIEQIGDRA